MHDGMKSICESAFVSTQEFVQVKEAKDIVLLGLVERDAEQHAGVDEGGGKERCIVQYFAFRRYPPSE
jgi:hypothetical protein